MNDVLMIMIENFYSVRYDDAPKRDVLGITLGGKSVARRAKSVNRRFMARSAVVNARSAVVKVRRAVVKASQSVEKASVVALYRRAPR